METPLLKIRPATPEDLTILADLCLATAYNGSSAQHLVAQPSLLSELYLKPYFFAENTLCLVAEYQEIVRGYFVAALHTEQFVKWLNNHWLPPLRTQYPRQKHYTTSFERSVYETIHETTEPRPYPRGFSGHLHLSVDPRAHRMGIATQLIRVFEDRLSPQLPGYHIEVSIDNFPANQFFKHRDFKEVYRDQNRSILVKHRANFS